MDKEPCPRLLCKRDVFPPIRQAVPGCFIVRCAALWFRSNPSGVQRAGNTLSTGLCIPDGWRRWPLLPVRVDLPLHPLHAAVESGACGAKGGRHPRIASMPSCRKTAYIYRNALLAKNPAALACARAPDRTESGKTTSLQRHARKKWQRKAPNPLDFRAFRRCDGTPGETRTHYIPLRRRTLYPGEVRGHGLFLAFWKAADALPGRVCMRASHYTVFCRACQAGRA